MARKKEAINTQSKRVGDSFQSNSPYANQSFDAMEVLSKGFKKEVLTENISRTQDRTSLLASPLHADSGLVKYSPANSKSRTIEKERIRKNFDMWCKYYELWLAYPDKLVDALLPIDTTFKLLPPQIVALRVNFRYRRVSQTATRGWSKSFMAFLTKQLKSVLLPGNKETVVAEAKQQSAAIARSKIKEINDLMPMLQNEVNTGYKSGTSTANSADYVRIVYKSKAELDVVGLTNTTRGGRRSGIIFEEFKDLPETEINEIVLPLVNIPRRTRMGDVNPNEPHQQQLYVGSAGLAGSFAHQKTLEIAVDSIFYPHLSFVWGGTWRVPVKFGLLSKFFIEELTSSGSYDEASFSREYESIWSTTIDGGAFDYEKLLNMRTLASTEWKAEQVPAHVTKPDFFYMLTIDVARSGKARTILEVLKVYERADYYRVNVVNILTMENASFKVQDLRIKQLDQNFNFRTIVIDANGLGIGLVDYLMNKTMDSANGAVLPGYNVQNIDEYPAMKPQQVVGQKPKLWMIKANGTSASQMHTNAFTWLYGGKVNFLISAFDAKTKFSEQKAFGKLSMAERIQKMQPYHNTDLLIQETTNLQISSTSLQFKLERINASIQKDTFSALEYGLWVIDKYEKEWLKKKNKRRISYADAILLN